MHTPEGPSQEEGHRPQSPLGPAIPQEGAPSHAPPSGQPPSGPPPSQPPPSQPPAPQPPPSQPPAPQPPVPWRLRDAVLVVGGGLLLVIASLVLVFSILAAGNVDLSVAWFVFAQLVAYAGQTLLAWYVIFRLRRAGPEDAGLTWVGAGPILLMFPALFGVLFVNIVVSIISTFLFSDVTTAQEQVLGSGQNLSFGSYLLMSIVIIFVAPVVEEFVFRGVLFKLLRSRRSFWFASSITSVVFSISHLIPSLLLSFFALGMILSAVVERYKSLYPAMALHAINNAFALTVVYLTLN